MATQRLPQLLQTHVGGWPAWLTGEALPGFDLQLDGDLPNLDLGPDGQCYFGLQGSEWAMVWEVG